MYPVNNTCSSNYNTDVKIIKAIMEPIQHRLVRHPSECKYQLIVAIVTTRIGL